MTKKLIYHLARRSYLCAPHQIFAQMIGASLQETAILKVDFPIGAETLSARRLLRVEALIVQRHASLGVNPRRFGVCWMAQG